MATMYPDVRMDPALAHADPPDLATILGNFRTGFMWLDTLLVCLVPLMVQQLVTMLQNGGDATVVAKLWHWLRTRRQAAFVERSIEITQRYNRDGYKVWDYEQKNHLLQKAISLYLSDRLNLAKEDAKYELLEKPKSKEEGEETGEEGSTTNSSGDSVDLYDDDYDDDYSYSTEIDRLSVEALPLTNRWVEVQHGIFFQHQVVTPENPGDRKGVSETKVIFRFHTKLPNGSDRLDELIETAYEQYQEKERRKHHDDKKRYFYIQSGTKASDEDSSKQVVAYKRYPLGEEKTFENLFFDEKEQVLTLLDNFMHKRGKFAIKGFPYKLGFLLHGPPGTGKTSLVKAIAQYTKRHVVTINLGKITSNQELMNALFDLKFAVDGLDTPVQMSLKDVVFVMEDIDCASSIVTSRNDDPKQEKQEKGDKKDGETETEEEGKKMEGFGNSPVMPKSEEDKFMSMMIKMVLDDEKKNSKLNLAGLLNVLDGVIDCPGRIIIMTTNHPEKLDKALIRPGRVNKKLLMSYMRWEHVQQMIEYYSQITLTQEQVDRLQTIMEMASKQVSPAEVEELCAEFEGSDAILTALEKLSMGESIIQ